MSPPRSSSSRSDVVSISRRSVVLSPGGIGIGGNNASGLGLLTNEDNIRVHCRLRPLSLKEKAQGGTECLSVSETNTEIEIITPNNNYGPVVEVFSFHRVFDADTSQEEIFNETAEPLIENLFAGYNATILAYGQTGSGKTHTMYGSNCSGNTLDGMGIDPDCGIIPRTTRALFSRMNNKEKMGQDAMTFTLKVSFIEIYNEAIRDLFDDRGKKGSSLQTREDPLTGEFIVLDVTELLITSSEELLQLMERGSKNRAVGVTNMNEKSSRSHSLFSITLLQENPAQHTSISSKVIRVTPLK